jgi:hypothetical protein
MDVMKPARTVPGLLAILGVALVSVGCADKTKVPPPDDPADPVEPTMMAEPPPEEVRHLAGLVLEANNPTKVTVDGRDVGTTPITVENLEPGVHTVVFVSEKEGKVTLSVELAEGEYKKMRPIFSPDASEAKEGE